MTRLSLPELYLGDRHTYCNFSEFLNCTFRLNGSYEALEAGNIADALVDFTGGVCESTNLQETAFSQDEDSRLAYFKSMQKAMGQRSLIGASISVFYLLQPVLLTIPPIYNTVEPSVKWMPKMPWFIGRFGDRGSRSLIACHEAPKWSKAKKKIGKRIKPSVA